MLNDRIARLLQDRKPGHSLPRDFYVDEDLSGRHEGGVRNRLAVCLQPGRDPAPGRLQIVDNPIVVLRNRDGAVAAFPRRQEGPGQARQRRWRKGHASLSAAG